MILETIAIGGVTVIILVYMVVLLVLPFLIWKACLELTRIRKQLDKQFGEIKQK